jgi:hypothetical protein
MHPDTETPTTDAPIDADVEEPTTAPEPHAERDEDLGDAGKRALEAERKARRNAERAAKAAQAELEAAREASLSETERAIAQAARDARTAAYTEFNSRLVKAEARAIATGRLADPSDVAAFIDLSTIEVDEDGTVDTKAISKAIDDLIKTKPYLAAQRVGGDVDGGARGKPSAVTGDMNSLIRQAAGRA